jgi:hypothetical protein
MLLKDMLKIIHRRVRQDCFMDVVEESGNSVTTVWKWRNDPPDKPSLLVFSRFARYCGLNPTIDQLGELQ